MNFNERVYALVKKIPYGKVTSYGFVALCLGQPRAARQVGWALAALGPDSVVPWWRVVNREGFISIRGHQPDIKDVQRALLRAEGVEVNEDYNLNLADYVWDYTPTLTTPPDET